MKLLGLILSDSTRHSAMIRLKYKCSLHVAMEWIEYINVIAAHRAFEICVVVSHRADIFICRFYKPSRAGEVVGVLGPTAHPGLPLKVFLGVGRCQRL
jgi:hypothetical protein